jgi:hypothetical protein
VVGHVLGTESRNVLFGVVDHGSMMLDVFILMLHTLIETQHDNTCKCWRFLFFSRRFERKNHLSCLSIRACIFSVETVDFYHSYGTASAFTAFMPSTHFIFETKNMKRVHPTESSTNDALTLRFHLPGENTVTPLMFVVHQPYERYI